MGTGRKNIKFNLVDNAKDSLFHAVEHLTAVGGPKAGDLKRAIRDAAHAVEILLKERVRRIHPAFVWKRVEDYPRDGAPTIGTRDAIARLLNLEGIKLSQDSQATLLECRKIRNKIEHYEFDVEWKTAQAIVGRILSFIFDFAKRHLELDFETEFRADDRWNELVEIYEFWEAHGAALEKQMREEGRYAVECPTCGATTFDLERMTCELCGSVEELVECENCGALMRKSDTETFEGSDVDDDGHEYDFSYTICHACREKEYAEEAEADRLLEEWKATEHDL